MRFTFAFLLALTSVPALADNTALVCYKAAGTSNCIPVTSATPLPVAVSGSPSGAPTPTIPPNLTAYGTLAVTTSSVAVSTLTPGPNSPAWSTTLPNRYITVRNSVNSTAILYFCPLGGTCTASVGEPIAIGETVVRQLASPATPTLICGTATACTAVAEE